MGQLAYNTPDLTLIGKRGSTHVKDLEDSLKDLRDLGDLKDLNDLEALVLFVYVLYQNVGNWTTPTDSL